MSSLLKPITQLFEPIKPISPGTYHFIAPQDDPRNYRLHLRVESDGRGVLIVNASTVLHLNETATEYAYYFVENYSADRVAKLMSNRYRVDTEQSRIDYRNLADKIIELIETPDLDPVTFLDFDRVTPYSGKISAPYRLDCALTYRLPDTQDIEYAPTKRVTRELTTDEWKSVLDKAWEVGIPHVMFTGGEPTLRDDLEELILHAEHLGQVSGLLTDGLKLCNTDYLNNLLQTGLDHLLIILHPENDDIWTGLERIIAGDIYTAVHLTIRPDNVDRIEELLEKLAKVNVNSISLSAISSDLDSNLEAAREMVAATNVDLVWDLPVPYSAHNPVALEVDDSKISLGPGHAWLYIEPDGDVLPAQGINRVLGNCLTDSWGSVWSAALNLGQVTE